MIKREEKLLITFHTTAAAMAMEQACRRTQADGRLVPVPSVITADCGLAWCAAPESEEALLALMHTGRINFQGIYRCLI